jgi:hypothetical protein
MTHSWINKKLQVIKIGDTLKGTLYQKSVWHSFESCPVSKYDNITYNIPLIVTTIHTENNRISVITPDNLNITLFPFKGGWRLKSGSGEYFISYDL